MNIECKTFCAYNFHRFFRFQNYRKETFASQHNEGKPVTKCKMIIASLYLGREIADLKHAESLMGWIRRRRACHPNGAQMRARAQGSLSGLIHERLTETEFVRTVERLQDREFKMVMRL